MDILSIGPPPADSAVDVYRQDSVVGSFAASAMGLGLAVAFGFATTRCFEMPLLMTVMAIPMMGLGALFALAMAGVMFQVAIASTKPTNWLLALSETDVYLNLRSARNASTEDGTTTAVRFGTGEIISVSRVREVHRERSQKGYRTSTTSYIELQVTGWDPGELEALIEVERTRKGESRRIVGVETRGMHHHLPVFTLEPDRIRLAWSAGLFKALGARFHVAEPREVDLTELLESISAEERVRAFVLRGQRFKAMMIAQQELGLKMGPAKALVDAPLEDAA